MSIVLINVVGQCGPFLGTNMFPTSDGPRFIKGMSVCAAFMFFSAFLAFSQRLLLMWENVKLDREYGTTTKDKTTAKSKEVAAENYGPNFRYVL